MSMTIEEICKAARAEGISYGQYVFKHCSVVPKATSLALLTQPTKRRLSRNQRCRQFDLNGVLIAEYESVDEAAAAVGTTSHNLSAALRGDNATSMGYQWRYSDDPTKVTEKEVICQYTPDGELIGVYKTIQEATAVCGKGSISRAIAKKIRAGGYYWRREHPARHK